MSPLSDPNRPGFAERPGSAAPPPAPRPSNGGGNVPGAVAAVIVAFAAGLLVGAAGIGLMGYRITAPKDAAPPPGAPTSMSMPMPGGPGGTGGMRGPSPKGQLASLVAKLDALTDKPLAVQLTAEQRKQIQEQLNGLADAKELSDDEAKTKLDKILDVLKDQKDTMEKAGYRWPGGGGAGGPPQARPPAPANPFTTEANAGHLKSLSERLEKGGNG